MRRQYFDLAGEVLDHSIVDVNDYPCGKVDNIEIEGNLQQGFRVKALLVGSGVWLHRLPHWLSNSRILRRMFGDKIVTVPWEQIQQITPKVKLKLPVAALGLGKTDRKANRLMSRLLGR
jgi:sporulation protein YlmC with PRC-barrel domain